MGIVAFPETQLRPTQPLRDRVVLITSGSRANNLAEKLRESIRQCGCDCQVFRGDVSDRTQKRRLVSDVLECIHQVGEAVNIAAITRDHSIPKMTDEEWLAQ